MSNSDYKGFSGFRYLVTDLNDNEAGDKITEIQREGSDGYGDDGGKQQGELRATGEPYSHDTETKESGLSEKGSSSDAKVSKKFDDKGVVGDGKYFLAFALVVIVVFFIVIVYEAENSVRDQNSSPVVRSSEENVASHDTDIIPETDRPSSSIDLTYQEPAPGDNNILSMPELRWCVRGSLVIDTIRPHLDTPELTDTFNSLVRHYNERCASFRYRNNDYQIAMQQIEEIRDFVEDSALTSLYLERGIDEGGGSDSSITQTEVQEAQRLLRELGYSVGPIDGIFGPQTREAIASYYRDRGIESLEPEVTRMLLVWLRNDTR